MRKRNYYNTWKEMEKNNLQDLHFTIYTMNTQPPARVTIIGIPIHQRIKGITGYSRLKR